MAENFASSFDAIPGWLSGLSSTDALGVLGVLIYVGAYFCLQIGLLKGDDYKFSLLNLLASACILASLFRDYNAYSTTVEITWSIISIIGLTRLYLVHKLIRLSEEEAKVAGILVRRLKKDRVRKLLKIGAFVDAAPGTEIVAEGQPVRQFSVIVNGRCRIEKGGEEVAAVGSGAMLGEVTYASGAPATATVIVDAPSRLFVIDGAELRQFLARNPDIALEMELNSASDMRSKLSETTRHLSELRADNNVQPSGN